ncbi:MAG TPA: dicarboxylate/amino acid:cation symporter [Acidobacteriota bacterium]|nr:dicarboxylate/amino acid:cation symporter [Acidobacteriota bacterium]HNB70029.1 dicarboxylate/amino acid:cation symporter [Acidobacteriota bacterium]HND18046.1 dicarboxylate/amino acid:cation symporter [Acidobacteriota bacterium]HNG92468.1 dicarboxylate/amino acid:cation symporter [Acidobacteriota bacterium]HNH81015.1 dicarboxylate/amino acid:cation symporter [Acidobacteriota bacterium]
MSMTEKPIETQPASGDQPSASPALPDSMKQKQHSKKLPLHTRILIGLAVGASLGIVVNSFANRLGPEMLQRVDWVVMNITEPVGALFLRLLLMIVVPLVFSSLVVGVAGVGDIRKLGRIGLKSFAYTLVISAISVVIGLGLANTIKPGKRISPATSTQLQEKYGSDAKKRVEDLQKTTAKDSAAMQVVKTIVPSNPANAVALETPNMLHLMFFALVVGVALTLVPAESAAPVLQVLEGAFAVTSKIVEMIMYLAPYAVACLLFTNTARFGLELLQALSWFVVTVLLGLSLQMFGVYSLSVYFLSGLSPMDFFRRMEVVILTAFSTSSSNATLPTALRVSEENLGVPRNINTFVLTVGATANQNGTALYEGVTVLFLAQLAGVDLTLGQQLLVVYLAILGGVGTAGVPSGSIPFIVAILAMIGVPPTLIAIILGVDRILDMCRTTLNVVGDITVATYVARSEGYELLKTAPVNTDL